jgi:DNA-binding response OmpR family regulator
MTTALAGRRVLVAEDEYFIAADLTRALAGAGAVVVGPVGRVDQALALIADAPVSAAVLDVDLGGESSFAIADRLAAARTPLLFVTGYDGWSLPEGYRGAPRLGKPFAMEAVLAEVAGLIGERP